MTGTDPELADLTAVLAGRRAILDGEIVALMRAERVSGEFTGLDPALYRPRSVLIPSSFASTGQFTSGGIVSAPRRVTRVLLDGLGIGECPRWHDDRLWFCNWGTDQIVAVDVEGNSEVVMDDATVSPHSIDWLPDGRLLIVPGTANRGVRLLVQDADGSLTPYGHLDGLPSGFNEITVDGRGNVYVNGADFDFLAFLDRAMKDMAAGDQTPLHQRPDFVPGYIALITPDGTARQVANDIAFPNGMVVTPDNRTLIISESFTGTLTAFDIAEDGQLSNRRVFADGLGPDGICIDAEGAVWTSQGQRDCVRVAEGGKILDRVELDRDPFACMLGGPDGQTLFIMAAVWNPENPFGGPRTGQVLATEAPAPHVGWP